MANYVSVQYPIALIQKEAEVNMMGCLKDDFNAVDCSVEITLGFTSLPCVERLLDGYL